MKLERSENEQEKYTYKKEQGKKKISENQFQTNNRLVKVVKG
jgi:hypothetical protein